MAIHDGEGSETSTEVEFRVRDPQLFFVRASRRLNCCTALEEMVQRSDGRLLEYFTVQGASPESVLTAAADAADVDDARRISGEDDGHLFEFIISGPCIGGTLADAGALVRTVVATDGEGCVVADVPSHVTVREVVETVQDRHDVDFLARRERDRTAPEYVSRRLQAVLTDQLTERQLEVLRAAHVGGYFDWPRESTAEECAEALGISQPTFAQHIRAAEQKIAQTLFSGHTPPAVDQ